ncbi:hypothetical protein ACFL4Q_03695 [candidate division KSB1 bacterium]
MSFHSAVLDGSAIQKHGFPTDTFGNDMLENCGNDPDGLRGLNDLWHPQTGFGGVYGNDLAQRNFRETMFFSAFIPFILLDVIPAPAQRDRRESTTTVIPAVLRRESRKGVAIVIIPVPLGGLNVRFSLNQINYAVLIYYRESGDEDAQ